MKSGVTTPDGADATAEAHAAANRVREGVPAGSLRHLSVLFSGSPERAAVEAIYAFDAEVRRIVAATSHEAAHARLQWWRGEIDRLAAGRPGHPLAQALLPLRGRPGLDLAQLHEMLVAADLDLARMTYRDWRELDAYLSRAAATTQRLIAATLAVERGVTPAEAEFAHRLGAATRQVEMLFDLERDLARGRMYAPTEALEAVGIDPPAFARDWRSERARRARGIAWALARPLDSGDLAPRDHGTRTRAADPTLDGLAHGAAPSLTLFERRRSALVDRRRDPRLPATARTAH